MRVLFDHCFPVSLRRLLPGHDVTTTREKGWDKLKNGELLREAAAAGFEAFVTVDQSLRHQQNLTALPIPVAAIETRETHVNALLPFVPQLQRALSLIELERTRRRVVYASVSATGIELIPPAPFPLYVRIADEGSFRRAGNEEELQWFEQNDVVHEPHAAWDLCGSRYRLVWDVARKRVAVVHERDDDAPAFLAAIATFVGRAGSRLGKGARHHCDPRTLESETSHLRAPLAD